MTWSGKDLLISQRYERGSSFLLALHRQCLLDKWSGALHNLVIDVALEN